MFAFILNYSLSPESLITQHMTLKWSKGNSDIQNKTSFIIKKNISWKKNTMIAFKFFQDLKSIIKLQKKMSSILNSEDFKSRKLIN